MNKDLTNGWDNLSKEDLDIILPKKQLEDKHLVYLSDEMYTPIHYKSMIVQQPFYEGRGNHSVAKLEEICEQFKEYCHQQAIIKQNCMKHIVELKFNVKFEE